MKKTTIFLTICIVLILSCTMIMSCSKNETYYEVNLNAENLVSISEGTVMQTINGFGSSSCWWSQVVGGQSNADEIAQYLYGKDGVALNIYRYNIGGGSHDILVYDNIDRTTESFLIQPTNYLDMSTSEILNYVSNPNNYDFSKDANAQNMLKKCYDLGNIDTIVLFVNSPHYIMTKNHKTHGEVANDNNLPEENYQAYAQYLMQILKYFVVDKAYPIKYLSPINEPQWEWGGDGASQEGCHYDPKNAADCINVVYNALKQFNSTYNTNVKLDVYESGGWHTGSKTINGKSISNADYLEELRKLDFFSELDHISFHSYNSPTSKDMRIASKNELNPNNDYNVAITEFCQMDGGVDMSFGTAQYLSYVMAYDFKYLNAQEWTWWIGVSNPTTYNYNDGLCYTDWWDNENMSVAKATRSIAFEHYTHFVKPGDKYVEVKISNKKSQLKSLEKLQKFYSNATYDDDVYNVFTRDDGTVIIVYNNVTNYDYTWNFSDQYKSFASYISTSADSALVENSGNFTGSFTFPKNSITTLVLK